MRSLQIMKTMPSESRGEPIITRDCSIRISCEIDAPYFSRLAPNLLKIKNQLNGSRVGANGTIPLSPN